MRGALFAILSVFIATGCSRSQDQEILPWFKVRIHSTPNIGGFSGGTTGVEAYVKRYGFWHRVAERSGSNAIVLDPRTVLFPGDGSYRIIREGESSSRLACESKDSSLTFPKGLAVYDCVDLIEGTAFMPTRLRWRRMDVGARVVAEQPVEAGEPGRVLMGPAVMFYDRAAAPYFVTRAPDDRVPACVLVGKGSAQARTVPAREGASLADCSSSSPWSRVAGFPLDVSR